MMVQLFSPRVIPSTLTTHHGCQSPQPSPCAKHGCLFDPIRRPSPYPRRVVWHRPSSSRSSLARDYVNGSNVHRCSCRLVVVMLVVMLIVMLVVVLLLSVVPSRRCCHRCRCHRQTTNAQRPSPSPWPPLSPLPSQSHSLQLSPPSSPCRRFHRRFRRHGHCPRRRIANANSLNSAITTIAGCRHHRGHRRGCCHRRCIRCSHRCRHRPHLRCHHRRSLHRRLHHARSASPDAWAFGDDNPSRRDASELEARWRGLEIRIGLNL